MAKNILYIADGVQVNASWVNHIVISNDGVNWDAISKAGISVGKHSINLNTSITNSYPERGETSGFVITLKQSDAQSPKLSFDPSKVLNQAAWNTGAASPAAGAIQAMDDIITWLG